MNKQTIVLGILVLVVACLVTASPNATQTRAVSSPIESAPHVLP